jgi:hypothetical protein
MGNGIQISAKEKEEKQQYLRTWEIYLCTIRNQKALFSFGQHLTIHAYLWAPREEKKNQIENKMLGRSQPRTQSNRVRVSLL